ncbi:uncharacterized protein [Antedon mediterranea]|uniref:uncharacterized protein n=1 Tax=Antedon mediterranea TaxID=105859 RepID=UPI003AF65233
MLTARVLPLKRLPKNQWLRKLTSQIFEWPSPNALKEAELLWIRQRQSEINVDDYNIMKLDSVFDEKDGVYRVGGRIKNAPLSYYIRHPYLLPKRSHISLLIEDRHRNSFHGGHLRTASEVRKSF